MMTHNQDAIKPLNEDDAFFSSIGRFLFEFSQLEYALRVLVAEIADVPDEHFNSIMTHDVALLCTAAKNVFANLSNGDLLTDIVNKINALNADRVRIAHGLWVPKIDGGKLFHVPRTKLQPSIYYERSSGREVARLADYANELRFKLESAVAEAYHPTDATNIASGPD
jgi:hypothetical protein